MNAGRMFNCTEDIYACSAVGALMSMKTHNFCRDLLPNGFPGAINVWIGPG